MLEVTGGILLAVLILGTLDRIADGLKIVAGLGAFLLASYAMLLWLNAKPEHGGWVLGIYGALFLLGLGRLLRRDHSADDGFSGGAGLEGVEERQ